MGTKTPENINEHKASDVEHAQVGYFVPVPSIDSDSEIDLLQLWKIIWEGRWMITSIAFAFAVLSAIGSLLMPDIYRGDVLLASVSIENDSGGIASKIGGLGGLASLAGFSLQNAGDAGENLAILGSKDFLWRFFEEKNLLPPAVWPRSPRTLQQPAVHRISQWRPGRPRRGRN